MKNVAGLVGVLLGGMWALGCAPSLSQFEGRKRDLAPDSNVTAGILVRGSTPESLAALLQRHSSAEFRVLNEAHQMYEVFGLSLNDVQGELPQAEVSQNTFIDNDFETPAPSERLQLYANEKPPGELQKCVEGANPPQAVIKILVGQDALQKRLLFENDEIRLSASGSLNKEFPGQPLRMAWVVMAPRGALETEQIVSAAELTYKTVALGGYGIGLIVQDSRNVCSLDILEFAVTANRKYLGRNPANNEELGKIDLSKMPHLRRLHAQESWLLSQGQGIVIAVIDSGVNFNHVALRDNILLNENEIPNNNLDDDGNGFKDDEVGWDFNFNDSSPFDDVGHGSHVAGLAASAAMGMAKKAKILPIKALGAFGGDVGSVAAAIRYAVDRKANIINLSLGSHSAPKRELLEAIGYAEAKGVLILAAAGNGHPMTGIGLNTDQFPVYPAGLTNNNILNVAALGKNDNLTTYSNFGADSVDVAAPGGEREEMLLSAFLENPSGLQFVEMSGTSMATPIVAGMAAQVWALNPKFTALEVKARLMSSGPELAKLKNLVQSGRGVDALGALLPSHNLL